MNRLTLRLLYLVARVRPEERRDATAAFLTLLGFMTGHALLETARDALFLARLPARQLPWVYLTIAVVALALGQREPRVVRRFSSRSELTGWLVVSAAVTLFFWMSIGWAGAWIFYALYTWSGVLATLVVVRFWTVLGNLFTVTQAKRVFAVIGSGSVLGAILGSALARLVTGFLPARSLVLAAAGAFFVASFAPSMFDRSPERRAVAGPGSLLDYGRIGRMIWTQPYLRRVAAFIILSTVTFTLVDFVFKSTVDRFVPTAEFGAFFSSVYLGLNLASLAIQVLVVAWLLRTVGVNLALAVVPGLLLLGAVGFVALGGLGLALVLKSADGSLRHSLYRTGTELLFLPMSVELRTRVKGFIDVLGQRGGQALASVLILMILSVSGREGVFAFLAALTAGASLHLALDLKKHYLDLFRETLNEEIAPYRSEFPALDMASLESLLATLNGPDDRRVLAALDVLAAQGKTRVIPALILYHPSPSVIVRALGILSGSGRTDFLGIVHRLRDHGDEDVRGAAYRALSALDPNRELFEEGMRDPSARVRATAVAGLVGGDWIPRDQALSLLNEIVTEGEEEGRLALARAIRSRPEAVFEETLIALADRNEPAVRAEAIQAMKAVRSPAFVGVLVSLLAARSLRDEVRTTLVAIGPTALARLAQALVDPTLPHGVRRHLPLAIGTFGTPQAADILLRHLPREPDGMIRFKILRALGRWRSRQSSLPLDAAVLQQVQEQTLSTAFKFMRWRRSLEAGARKRTELRTELHSMLVLLLRDKQEHAVERIFRLLNLQAQNDDFHRVHRGLHSPKPASRASSRELLEHLLLPPVRRPLLTLVDDLFDAQAASPEPGASPDAAEYEATLAELLESRIESVSSLTAAHTAELGLVSLEPLLSAEHALSEEHGEVLAGAREALGGYGS